MFNMIRHSPIYTPSDDPKFATDLPICQYFIVIFQTHGVHSVRQIDRGDRHVKNLARASTRSGTWRFSTG